MTMALLLGVAAPAAAQSPGKVSIKAMRVVPATGVIELFLAGALSDAAREQLLQAPVSHGWHVVSLEVATGETQKLDIDMVRIDGSGTAVELVVDPSPRDSATWLETSTHAISVTCLRSINLGHAVLTPSAAPTGAVKSRAFGAAKTAQLSDVYFSGTITAADGAKPTFSFEARLRDDWRLGANRGAIGYTAEMAASQQTNADPDRIAIGATYRRVLAAHRNGLILHLQPVAGEFGRMAPRTTTVLTTAHLEHVLLPTTGTSTSVARLALVVFGGIETGTNLSNALDRDTGSGAVFRGRAAAHPYVVIKQGKGLLKNIKASALWEVRFLRNKEIDPGELDALQQPTLTRRARQHLKADLDIGLSEYVSLTVQHRWGYLPPVYKKVSPSLTVSLTFKGRWLRASPT